MRIVLGEGTDPGQAMELSALLIAVNRTEFGEADRKVLVGAGL